MTNLGSSVLLCQTVGTYAPIIQIGSLDCKALRCGRWCSQQIGRRLNVEDSPTLMAEKVGMRFRHPIEIGIFAVDGEHTHHAMLHE